MSETDKERNKILWEECPDAKLLVLRRPPADRITESVVREIISESQTSIRERDIQKLFSYIEPDPQIRTAQ
jgi:hypothetical protein